MPRVEVNLMLGETAGNHPFYRELVEDFHALTRRRHPRVPFVRQFGLGMALCRLDNGGDGYLGQIEASGRRNIKKATRLGYTFQRLDYNAHLDDIRAIRASTPVRQGRVPEDFLSGDVTPCSDPPSLTHVHDYAYFGVMKEGRLFAYDGCFVCGEICMVEQLLGHADHLADGIVPLLLTETARAVCQTYPRVRYYAYGTFFGGNPSLQRFKKKFGFLPHRVSWRL
jgi:hypothetical protein